MSSSTRPLRLNADRTRPGFRNEEKIMNWTLEVVPIPVTDVDAAKAFYVEKVGFHLDHDVQATAELRVVQLTPRGSGCSVVLGVGTDAAPGSLQGLQLVVADIQAARAELVERGVDVSEIEEIAPGDGGKFVRFRDPDGNGWAVQEIRARA
jgi:predicted enzyme related to lactoylglutathione lyase